MMFTEIGFWVDFVFIDQSSRDLATEVRRVLPEAIDACQLHFVMTDSALRRSWCCYEMAVFNQRPLAPSASASPSAPAAGVGVRPAPPLRSFVVPPQGLDYRGFDQTETTQPEDREVIRAYLAQAFPDGIGGVDLLMIQASLLGDRWATPGFAQYSDAEQAARDVVTRWLSERGA